MTIESPGSDEETEHNQRIHPAVQPAERGTGDGAATGDGRAGVGCAAGRDEQGGQENAGAPAARHTWRAAGDFSSRV